jgi:hypothetical protein
MSFTSLLNALNAKRPVGCFSSCLLGGKRVARPVAELALRLSFVVPTSVQCGSKQQTSVEIITEHPCVDCPLFPEVRPFGAIYNRFDRIGVPISCETTVVIREIERQRLKNRSTN